MAGGTKPSYHFFPAVRPVCQGLIDPLVANTRQAVRPGRESAAMHCRSTKKPRCYPGLLVLLDFQKPLSNAR